MRAHADSVALKDALAVLLLGTLCFLILPTYACDCSWFAYKALARIGVKLHTLPAVVGTMERASYRRGVVSVPPGSACMVYVHEFAHHDQFEHGLEAQHQGDAMWWSLEVNANKLTRDAIEHQSTCIDEH